MPKFSTHVALMNPEYQPANFAPGDEVPEWAIDQVGDHVLEPEETADSDESEDADGEVSEQDDADGEDADPPAADDQPDFTAAAPARRGRAKK